MNIISYRSALAGRGIAVALLPLVAIAQSGIAHAADGSDIFAHGVGSAAACAACHGASGEGQPDGGFPRIAGLNAAYIAKQLDDFAQGTRANETMGPIAKALSEPDRKAVADYLSRQTPPVQQSTAQAAEDVVAAGAKIAERGDWPKGLAACNQCHGPAGMGVGAAFPQIAGQSASYIEKQLQDWKAGNRGNDPLSLMTGVASKLDDDQIKAVAAYFASLEPHATRASEAKEPAR